ncbi:alpha/beta hydrolase [Bifidobacterium sp. ESL0790]|uniref:esterase/lipase family protein n=1 Tax=Bifidobacterium sp. ESL0790 TaxID=2983233 RepID=UPI0023F6562F|nr:alpha/beta hydrolase [Bifidobacterium sp. ESL0790]WEV71872.1 alpha/beta hydrolase [Bifidobacterium sp. ESL0790]
MGWKVQAKISGGHQLSVADRAQYERVAKTLTDTAGYLDGTSRAWLDATQQLQRERLGTPTCPTLSSGNPAAAGHGHTTMPFDRLQRRCQSHSEGCTDLRLVIDEMADLLIRAYSLYDDAERKTSRAITEATQLGSRISPKYTAAALTGGIIGGAIGGSITSGKPNAYGALTATEKFQQGLMSGLGSKVAKVNLVDGVRQTDELNKGASKVAKVSGMVKDLVQGNELEVRQVKANTEVVGESHDVAEAMENLRRLAEERLGKIQLNSGLSYGTIAIQKYRRSDGSVAWLVTIPGTDGKGDSPFGWEQNAELMSSDPKQRMKADSARMVVEAMRKAGIKKTDPVVLIGHSQGGIVAGAIAADKGDEFNIQHIVTAGSPIANHPIPSKTWVTSIEMDDELVAALDGADNAPKLNWLTIHGTAEREGENPNAKVMPDGSCIPGKNFGLLNPYAGANVKDTTDDAEITHWLKYHQAAYQNATDLGSPAVRTHEKHFDDILDGDLESTTYWQGRMHH